MNTPKAIAGAIATSVLATPAPAQPSIPWFAIGAGGGTSSGGAWTLSGTIGQAGADTLTGGGLSDQGGFWGWEPTACYANCDASTTAPVLNVLDFSCFLNRFAAGDTYTNCDGSTTAPILNILDFSCFLNAFARGCS